ncbi:MAG: glycerol-3-phosphate responsive antiterminator [Novibacillus thermophilus]|uniref:Glycerol-3-phosphate responsive antiterminator n=1 Tax=Novibacillus thermophilus TaxID=1471761 RepID=A0A1U9K7A9_9BACL|nr:glycerol-3-phosphate responsive antiterminator [Novibacillus thermophilus]AQS55949.1 hypothetical protein B0W44_09375 [Novibacillus thermophilus]
MRLRYYREWWFPVSLKRIGMKHHLPIMAGGLITELTDVETALKCGAIGISTSTQQLWQWQDGNE